MKLSHPLILLALLAAHLPAAEPEWPQFLGPDRNGISRETDLLDKFPSGGPKELWRAKGGVGMSGVAIRDGKLVTLVQREGKQQLIALDAASGKPSWSADLAPEYENQMGNGPRGTPAISGDRVFAFTGEGILAAVSLEKGNILWSHNVLKELKGKEADYGMASSPLVVGEQVIVIAGAPSATVVAYDTKSGKLAWQAGDDPAGYSSPALRKLGGQEVIATFSGASLLGIDPEKGSVLFRYPFKTDFGCNIATPLAVDGQAFISAGENHGSVLLEIKPAGSKLTANEVWTALGPKSVLRSEWQTPILLDGHLYGFDNVGGAGPVSHLTCINAATGERAWQQARFGKGNFIAADGKLWIVTINGELVLARASPKAYEELGRQQLIGKTRQAPALCDGKLYLRDDKEIVCVDVSGK